MIRLFKWFPCVLLIALVLAACSAPAQPTMVPQPPVQTTAPAATATAPARPVTLSVLYYYTTDGRQVVIQSMLDDFQRRIPASG